MGLTGLKSDVGEAAFLAREIIHFLTFSWFWKPFASTFKARNIASLFAFLLQ